MGPTALGSYASSTALSAEHYRLVSAVEHAPSSEHVHRALVDSLRRIKSSWGRRPPSPSTARHDLVLVLYCRTQRTDIDRDPLDAETDHLFQAAWALPGAVMLAGGGGKGALPDRTMGYRACAELFSPLEQHPLKLLLINTICTDLFAPPDSPKAEARWALALGAAASPSLASPELIPAIRERVLEFLVDPVSSDAVRRLALEALLCLVRTSDSSSSSDAASLVVKVREAVLSLLYPAPPSSSSATSSRHHSTRSRRHAYLSLAFLASLMSALSPSSPLHPVHPDAQQRLQLHLELLRRILDASEEDEHRTRYKGVKGVWAISRALEAVRAQLAKASAAGDGAGRVEHEIEAVVWEVTARMLKGPNEASDAVVLSALRLLVFLPSAVNEQHSETLSALLARLNTHLTSPASPVALLFALCALALLPPSTWAASSDDSDHKGKSRAPSPTSQQPQWGECAWRAILVALDHPDSTIRRAALALLQRVDANLVAMQYERLLASLSAPADAAASLRSSASGGSTRTPDRGGTKRTERILALTLEVLPFLSPPPSPAALSPPSALPAADALLALLKRPELALTPTTVRPALVVPVLEAFAHAAAAAQQAFARELLLGTDGAWGETVVAGLWAAGSVHALEGEDVARAVQLLIRWLAGEEGASIVLRSATNSDLLSLLQEPFLFALLRLLTVQPSLATETRLQGRITRASHLSTSPETTRLYVLLARLADPSAADDTTLAALCRVGERTRSAPLGEFSAALLRALPSTPATSSSPSRPAVSSRLEYPSPSSSTSPVRDTHHPPPAAPRAPVRSPAAVARERADLLRERSERGGRGARIGEPVESLATPKIRPGELPGVEEGEVGGQGDGGEGAEPPADLLIELEALDPFRPG
ncbi:hypothetical protein JCM3770_007112 [Rhodotorula araucariae]